MFIAISIALSGIVISVPVIRCYRRLTGSNI